LLGDLIEGRRSRNEVDASAVHRVATPLQATGSLQTVHKVGRRCRGDSEPVAQFPRTHRLHREGEVSHGRQIGEIHCQSTGERDLRV